MIGYELFYVMPIQNSRPNLPQNRVIKQQNEWKPQKVYPKFFKIEWKKE